MKRRRGNGGGDVDDAVEFIDRSFILIYASTSFFLPPHGQKNERHENAIIPDLWVSGLINMRRAIPLSNGFALIFIYSTEQCTNVPTRDTAKGLIILDF